MDAFGVAYAGYPLHRPLLRGSSTSIGEGWDEDARSSYRLHDLLSRLITEFLHAAGWKKLDLLLCFCCFYCDLVMFHLLYLAVGTYPSSTKFLSHSKS